MNFDDEICICGHSKGYHKSHSLDSHGGECEKCTCNEYTWGGFVKYVEPEKEQTENKIQEQIKESVKEPKEEQA